LSINDFGRKYAKNGNAKKCCVIQQTTAKRYNLIEVMKVVWRVGMKTGIFQMQEYLLTVDKKGIILSSQEEGNKKLKFADRQIKSITIIKKNVGVYELEMETELGIYSGVLAKTADVSEIFKALSETFGSKVCII
jgi:hypothetical protein